MLKNSLYDGYNLYFYDEIYEKIGVKILNGDFKNIKIIKDTKRNYVALIEVDGKKYIYKEPRNEFRIPQRKFMSAFKDGEALTTLKNIHRLIYGENLNYFADVYLAINKRRNRMIESSILIMEYVEGRVDYEFIDKEIQVLKSIHEKGVYHGDFNPGNFLVTEDGHIKVIDTQGKSMYFGKYRAHYDMLTMQIDSYNNMKYPYEKDIWYYLALGMKKLKRIKLVEEIKGYKKKLRDRGWKI